MRQLYIIPKYGNNVYLSDIFKETNEAINRVFEI